MDGACCPQSQHQAGAALTRTLDTGDTEISGLELGL